jgi:hypothetical protein
MAPECSQKSVEPATAPEIHAWSFLLMKLMTPALMNNINWP